MGFGKKTTQEQPTTGGAPATPPAPPVDPKWKKKDAPNRKFFKFESIGEALEGKFLGLVKSNFKTDEGQEKFDIKVEVNGEQVCTSGSAQLITYFSEIPVGTEVRVVYTGKVKSTKGRWVKNFDVFTA